MINLENNLKKQLIHKYDIVCFGEALIDMVNNSNEIAYNPGGAPLNVCAVLAKYHLKTAFIGKIGNDDEGKILLDKMEELKIDYRNVVTDYEHKTTSTYVLLDTNGERHFSFNRDNTADVNFKKNDINPEIISNTKVFHFGSLSLVNNDYEIATKTLLDLAKANNCIISFDPNYREKLWKSKNLFVKKIEKLFPYIDIIKLSKEEALLITKINNSLDALSKLSKYNFSIILITDGENGAMFKTSKCIGNSRALKVNAIDTTGAGDIFLGTFLYNIIRSNKNLKDLSYEELLDYCNKACRNASMSTTTKGGIPSIPNLLN